jgi:hypothetical protein
MSIATDQAEMLQPSSIRAGRDRNAVHQDTLSMLQAAADSDRAAAVSFEDDNGTVQRESVGANPSFRANPMITGFMRRSSPRQ